MFFQLDSTSCYTLTIVDDQVIFTSFHSLSELRDSFSFIETADGKLSWYKTCVKTSTRINKAKSFVLGCHLRAQLDSIPEWVKKCHGVPSHAVVTRTVDDTNVWTMGEGMDDPAGDTNSNGVGVAGEGEEKEKHPKGRRKAKVVPVMGLIQRICARFPAEKFPQCVRVNVPYQVLPKAAVLVVICSCNGQFRRYGCSEDAMLSYVTVLLCYVTVVLC